MIKTANHARLKVTTVSVNGREFNSLGSLFQFDSLADAGMIEIESYGSENVYFTFTDDSGMRHAGYCKCL